MSQNKKAGISVSACKSHVNLHIDLHVDGGSIDSVGKFYLHLSREDASWLIATLRKGLG